MATAIRQIGNSAGTLIPAAMLKASHLSIGDEIEFTSFRGKLVIEKKVLKPKYSLDELLAQCDLSAAPPKESLEWDAAPVVGNEAW